MLYNNDIMALEESGFDVVDALLDCPIYESYTNYVEAVMEAGYMTEADKIKFKVLEEGALETIANAIKKAWEAIKTFFRTIAEKIGDFFKRISANKIADAVKKRNDAVDKKVKDPKLSFSERKKLLVKEANICIAAYTSIDKDLRKEKDSDLTFVDVNEIDREVINSSGWRNLQKLMKKLPTYKSLSSVKTQEQANKIKDQLKDPLLTITTQTSATSLDGVKYRTTKMNQAQVIELLERHNKLVKKNIFGRDVQSKLDNISDAIDKLTDDEANKSTAEAKKAYDALKKLRDDLLVDSRSRCETCFNAGIHYKKLCEEFANHIAEVEKTFIVDKKENTGYGNQVANEINKVGRGLLNIVQQDKSVISLLSSKCLQAYKKNCTYMMRFAGGGEKADQTIGANKQSNKTFGIGESYDPWAEMGLSESSFDPWAEIY